MKKKFSGNEIEITFSKILFVFSLFSLLTFTGCNLLEEFKFPAQSFTSKYIASYQIKKIALLPIMPDTKDSSGAFNSTDYFNELLIDCFSDIQFADVDDIRKHDVSFIPDMLDDIKKFHILDYKNFLNTTIGIALKEWNCDAILIGSIDSTNYESGWMVTYGSTGITKGRKTNCYFRYFLVSLKDGRILWKVSARGSEIYIGKVSSTRINPLTGKGFVYPPIDVAIVGGIELIAGELPKELFKRHRELNF